MADLGQQNPSRRQCEQETSASLLGGGEVASVPSFLSLLLSIGSAEKLKKFQDGGAYARKSLNH